ncbi:hypothetical protein BH11MYX3_BH11MYX3_20580 [soil metagenome]
MRLGLFLLLAAGCASAGVPNPGGGDDTGNNPDARHADAPIDACPDTDNDGACNDVDKCVGFDDRTDTDADTIADGCDKCPGKDDRPDLNMNSIPDCSELMTRTIDVKKVGANFWRGWQANLGATHATDNDNTVTGTVASTVYNSYFVFSLVGFTATAISEVKLEIEMESYAGDASEVISVWDVTTPSSTVETTGLNAAIHADLGGGLQYGTATVTAASVGAANPVPFMLNAQAATDLKAKLGAEWVVGLHIDAAPGYVRFSAATEARIARIVVKYLP